MELDPEIREFLVEGNEYLAVLDRDLLALEDNPDDPELISSVFRAVHTIKGTCGFFGYDILGSVTHLAESILGQVREHERPLTSELVSLILESLDAARILFNNIEASGKEGEDFTGSLRSKLEEASILPSASSPGPDAVAHPSAYPVGEPTNIPSPVAPLKLVSKADEANRLRTQPDSAPVVEEGSSPVPVDEGPTGEFRSRSHRVELVAGEDLTDDSSSHLGRMGGRPESSGSFERPSEDHAQDTVCESTREASIVDSTIRVDVALLDRLMNLVGELVLARNQLLQNTQFLSASLQQTSQRLNQITSELQEGVMKTRMQPIGVIWNKFPRVVRDLAAKFGKCIRTEMEGTDTELDKTVIEAIRDPLTHIIRNSCDHGIEVPEVRRSKGKDAEGVLLLRAYHEGGVVNIEISDDGAGIDSRRVRAKAVEKGLLRVEEAAALSDREASQLIFLPGFSTAAHITSVSGRGVGMDVVKTNIEKIGGTVELLSRAGGGTTLRIRIPLTLAIIPGLVIGLGWGREAQQGSVDEQRFIIPQANLLELVRIEPADFEGRILNVYRTPVFRHRGRLLPLVRLGGVLGQTASPSQNGAVNIVLLQAENSQLGLVVDRIFNTQEIVVKPLGHQLRGLACYVGATIMGDGRPALILDIAGLARLAGLGTANRQTPSFQECESTLTNGTQSQLLLLFRAGRFERLAVSVASVDRLEDVPTANLERSGVRPVLHYRGEILPLVSLEDFASCDWSVNSDGRETTPVIVFTNAKRRIGLVVDRILDIVEQAVSVRRPASTPGLSGSAVIGGKITDLLDLPSLFKHLGEDFLSETKESLGRKCCILLVEPSIVGFEALTNFLVARNFEVALAPTLGEAVSRIRQQINLGALLVSAKAPDSEKAALIEVLREECLFDKVPLIELVGDREESLLVSPAAAQVARSDHASLLEVLSRLVQDRSYEGVRP